MKLAIVIGVEKYDSLRVDDLPACRNDASAMRDVLETLIQPSETLYLNDGESALDIKNAIASLAARHQSSDLDEIVFYFSGHGTRDSEDFYYVARDFEPARRQTTALRNSELDNLVKLMKPKLFVKIVDACQSGTQYIKDNSTDEDRLKKAANDAGLKDIYFWFSSRDDRPSFADRHLSHFTRSILSSLTRFTGEVRYRDVMAAIADDLSSFDREPPIFIVQAQNIEKIGNVTGDLQARLLRLIGPTEAFVDVTSHNAEESEGGSSDKDSLATRLDRISGKGSHSKDDVESYLEELCKDLSNWDDHTSTIFTCSLRSNVHPTEVPNRRIIGNWLGKEGAGLFATPAYRDEEYVEKVYREVPASSRGNLWRNLNGQPYFVDETRYRKVLDGFEYSVDQLGICINLDPKFEILKRLTLFVIPFYSRRRMVLYYSMEWLDRVDWDSFEPPLCLQWHLLDVAVSEDRDARRSSGRIKDEAKALISEQLAKLVE